MDIPRVFFLSLYPSFILRTKTLPRGLWISPRIILSTSNAIPGWLVTEKSPEGSWLIRIQGSTTDRLACDPNVTCHISLNCWGFPLTDLDGYASQKIESLRAQAGLLLPRNGRCFEHSPLLAKETLHVSGSQVAVRPTGKKKQANYFSTSGVELSVSRRKKKGSFSEFRCSPWNLRRRLDGRILRVFHFSCWFNEIFFSAITMNNGCCDRLTWSKVSFI